MPGSSGTTRHYDLTSLDYAYSFQVRGVNSDGIGSNTSEASSAVEAQRNFIPESGGGLWASDRIGGNIAHNEFIYNGTTYQVNQIRWNETRSHREGVRPLTVTTPTFASSLSRICRRICRWGCGTTGSRIVMS